MEHSGIGFVCVAVPAEHVSHPVPSAALAELQLPPEPTTVRATPFKAMAADVLQIGRVNSFIGASVGLPEWAIMSSR